ncbi:hypothetical protein LEP1GSC096_0620 [Leptospira interrogans serovar Hebdomadis str. R499]|nr:hypothetical protein LEP1GSC096_0620 [Leptospira interrogans serovar Hebdomadis str. R499]
MWFASGWKYVSLSKNNNSASILQMKEISNESKNRKRLYRKKINL